MNLRRSQIKFDFMTFGTQILSSWDGETLVMSDAFLPVFFLGIRLFSFDVQIWVWVSLINSVLIKRLAMFTNADRFIGV
jgi:hypothetical protein